MNGLTLNPGERVLKENDNVSYGGLILHDSLILTNQALILVKKTLRGKIKDITRFPLEDIVVSDGQVQAHIGSENDFNPTLDLYLTTGREQFRFEWQSDIKEWIRSISEAVTGNPMPEEDDLLDDFAKFAETISGSVNKIKNAFGFGTKESVSCHCPSCGASITGRKGETIQCPYCGSYYTF